MIIPARAGIETILRRNLTAISISATSASVDSALAVILGCTRGSAERMAISPRLEGWQLDRPTEKPGHGSGLRIGRSPPFGMTVEKAWK